MTPKGIHGEDIPRGSMIVDREKIWGRFVLAAFVMLLLALAGMGFWLYRSEKKNTELTRAHNTVVYLLARNLTETSDSVYALQLRFSESGKVLLEEGPKAYMESVEAR